ncbi:MAG: type II secretion system protein GspF [Lysobacterales bacterium 69-70]|nr:type II secretion system inner membrane protein GspF [Xanthomonadaceae bacterium]ODU35873.1 MAG: type II secretion system protein GspF [Xanthomonadaceae bacterium SCN 69-320]ODV18375.1 MAG: type II secretion system protein GspF [Xanthomonadaceae bacterium SCN 69-25]OJY97356.1 MAG: type II secretion system protein GspF [Xanthomonadales bacterium 69-70]
MPAFAYQALDASGKTQRGVLQGDTARAVRQTLRERGLNPLEVTPVDEKQNASPLGRRGLTTPQLALFTRQLATLLSAGLPIDEALAALGEQGEDERSRSLTVALRSRVMEGAGLAAALADYPESFPEIYRASVAAGEQSGRLGTVLERLADYAESRDALRQKMITALAYPVLLALVAVAVVTGLLVYVVPQIVGVFASMKQALPLPTTVLIALSEFVKHWGVLLLLVMIVAAVAARFALRRAALRMVWHRWLLRLPLVGKLTRAANTARAARTLALLSASAVPLLDALAISAQVVPNLPMREALRRAAHKVREGGAFSRALADSGYFPPVAVRLIASGERSGQLERMLDEAAAHQAKELDRWLAVLTAVLGPAVILLVGAMVLFIVLAILLPIFNLNQMVK